MTTHRANLTWKDTEPVRLYLYGVLGPLVVLLVALGVVQADQALLWLAVGAAVLGVPAVEGARSLVTSPATQAQIEREAADRILDQAAAADGFSVRPAPSYDDLGDGRA
jgi:hypothetical protein